MKNAFASVISHREFLRACGLAVVGTALAQAVVPAQVASAYTYNEDLTVNGKLLINLSGSADGITLRKGGNTDRNWLAFWQGGGTAGTWRLGQLQYDDGLALYVGGTDPASPGALVMKWALSGGVGIGTAWPSATLDVRRGADSQGITTPHDRVAARFLTNLVNDGVAIRLEAGYANPNYFWDLSVNGGAGPGTLGPSGSLSFSPDGGASAAKVVFNANGDVGIGVNYPDARLDVAGDVRVLGGNLGIGASFPGAPLDVHRGTDSQGVTTPHARVAARFLSTLANDGAAIRIEAGYANPNYYWDLSVNGGLGPSQLGPSGSLAFSPDGGASAAKVVFKQDGTVGIGITDPAKQLDVAGDAQVTGAYWANGRKIADGTGVYYAD